MTPSQIESFLDRICGIFPSQQVSLTKAKEAWVLDTFLLSQTVQDGRRVVSMITTNFEKFPNLKQVRECFDQLHMPANPVEAVCPFCDNTGWIYATDEQGVRKTYTSGLRRKNGDLLEYEYVVRCECFTTK